MATIPAHVPKMFMSSPGLADWLAEQRVSLALTTYQAGRLFFVGRKPDGGLRAHEGIVVLLSSSPVAPALRFRWLPGGGLLQITAKSLAFSTGWAASVANWTAAPAPVPSAS